MKKQKILSFIFALVFIIASFPDCAGAASVGLVPADDDYENAFYVLNTICPGFPLADGETTKRGEFVEAVIMALNMKSAPAPASQFSDVPDDHIYAKSISHARNLGLISAVDLFYPDSDLTYAQAIKILTVAAGYGIKAELGGGFPTGYFMVANQLGIGKGTALSQNSSLSHSDAVKLIFETVCVDILDAASYGDSYNYVSVEGKNILSFYHGIFSVEGVVSSNSDTGLKSISASCADGYISVDGYSYKTSDCNDLLGRNARIFYRNDSSNTVICAYECKNKEYTFTDDDSVIIADTVATVSAQNSLKDEKFRLEDGYTIIYNGKCFNTADVNSAIDISSGTLTLLDNDDNNKIDVIIVKEVSYAVVGNTNEFEEKIYDKFKRSGVYSLSDVKYTVRNQGGETISIGDLKVDDAIGIVMSKDNKLCEIIRYNHKVGGVTEYFTSDGKISVAGGEYVLSDYYIAHVKEPDEIKLGKEVILHIGEGNRVICVQEFTASMNYGFFVAAGAPSGGIASETPVRIFGADGNMHEVNLADKVKVDGIPMSKQEAITELDAIEALPVIKRVVKYSVNSLGELTRIYKTTENTDGTKVLLTRTQEEAGPVLYDDNTRHGYVETSSASSGKLVFKNDVFYPYFTLAPECVILKVPKNESDRLNDKSYSVANTSEVKDFAASNGDSVECYGYDVDIDGATFILWASDSGGSATVGREAANSIVESVTRGVGPDGTDCYVAKLFADGKAEKYYSTEDTHLAVSNLKPGDIIQVSVNNQNEITALDVNFIYSSKTITGHGEDVQGYNGGYVGLAAGYVYNFSGKNGMIVRHKTMTEIENATQSFDFTDMFPISLNRGKVYFVKFTYDRNNKSLVREAIVHTESDTSTIESFFTSGSSADYVVQRARFHDVSYTIIYTN